MNYSLDSLVEQTGFSKRTIRFYIQQGVLDSPDGNTKGAVYTVDHLERLLLIRRLTKQGYSLSGIKQYLQNQDGHEIEPVRPGTLEVWTKITLREGLEVHLNSTRAKLSTDEFRQLSKEIVSLFDKHSKENN